MQRKIWTILLLLELSEVQIHTKKCITTNISIIRSFARMSEYESSILSYLD